MVITWQIVTYRIVIMILKMSVRNAYSLVRCVQCLFRARSGVNKDRQLNKVEQIGRRTLCTLQADA